MADSKQKIVAGEYIKVLPAVKFMVEDEATRLSRSEGKKVTQGQVVERAILALHSNTQIPAPQTGDIDASDLAKLESLAKQAESLAGELRGIVERTGREDIEAKIQRDRKLVKPAISTSQGPGGIATGDSEERKGEIDDPK